jgi:hypothetical protein
MQKINNHSVFLNYGPFPTLNSDDSCEQEEILRITVTKAKPVAAAAAAAAAKAEAPALQRRQGALRKMRTLIDPSQLNPKHRELFKSLDDFFTEEHLRDIMIPIQTQQRPVRLRTLEYLITAYARPDVHNVEYLRTPEDNFPWKLYRNYQDLLEYNNKRTFDPFRRGQKFPFRKGSTEVVTTVAQLNFFRWAIQNKVIDWALMHAQEINTEMLKTDALNRKSPSAQPPRKRKRSIRLNSSPMILNVKVQVKAI